MYTDNRETQQRRHQDRVEISVREGWRARTVFMKIRGHSTCQMSDRYNTVDTEDIKLAVDQSKRYLTSVDQTVDPVKESEFEEVYETFFGTGFDDDTSRKGRIDRRPNNQ